MPQDSLHLNQVNDTLEVLLSTDGHLDDDGVSAEDVTHLLYCLEEISTRTVHLIHITDTGYVILVCLAPYCLRLRLYTVSGRVSGYCTIEYTQGTLHLSSEVNVSRSVDKIDLELLAIPLPVTGRGGTGDGDTALLLLGHPVHGSSTVMYLTDLMCLTRIEKDTL